MLFFLKKLKKVEKIYFLAVFIIIILKNCIYFRYSHRNKHLIVHIRFKLCIEMCRDNLVFECIIMPLYACNDYYYYFNFVT